MEKLPPPFHISLIPSIRSRYFDFDDLDDQDDQTTTGSDVDAETAGGSGKTSKVRCGNGGCSARPFLTHCAIWK